MPSLGCSLFLLWSWLTSKYNTLRTQENAHPFCRRYFPKRFREKVLVFWLKLYWNPIDNKSTLVQVMTWCHLVIVTFPIHWWSSYLMNIWYTNIRLYFTWSQCQWTCHSGSCIHLIHFPSRQNTEVWLYLGHAIFSYLHVVSILLMNYVVCNCNDLLIINSRYYCLKICRQYRFIGSLKSFTWYQKFH